MSTASNSPSNFPWRTTIFTILIITIFLGGAFIFLKNTDKAINLAEKVINTAPSIAEKFKTGTITTHFTESITQISPTGGDILEVGSIRANESFRKKDSKNTAWDTIHLGETVAEIQTPVTFRYHIRLSDQWRLVTQNNVCIVLAPSIRATLPPAIHTDKMEKSTERGWARFNQGDLLRDLEKSITPTLNRRAIDKKHIDLVREASRQSIAEFVRKWLMKEDHWSEDLFTAIQVVFPDEVEYVSDENLQSMEYDPTVSISYLGENRGPN